MVAIRDMVKEKTLDLETIKARYYETGEGYPTIFLHGLGFTSGGSDWFPSIAEGIGEKVHVIALDMMSWGLDRPNWRFSLPYLVDHVREVQDKLGLKKTNMVGHSLGGWVSALLAYESPERVNKLVLVAHAGLNPNPPPNLATFKLPTKEEITAGLQVVEDADVRNSMIEDRWRHTNAPGAAEAYGRVAEMFQDMDMRRRYYLLRRLPEIKVPTMLIYGEEDIIYPPVTAEKNMREVVRDSIPGARYEVLPKTGHLIPTDNPKELTRLLKDFLG